MMDNRIFNINGQGPEMLRDALRLAFIQEGDYKRPATAKAWQFLPDKGFVINWNEPEETSKRPSTRLPVPMTADMIAPIVWAWLASEEAKGMKCEGWDANADHDGHNEPGWRVYSEDWGSVEGCTGYPICAVRPVFLWIGK